MQSTSSSLTSVAERLVAESDADLRLRTSFRFAVAIIPVYSDPSDHENSPHKGELANVEAMNWAWFSTINRVNSQVKKVSHDLIVKPYSVLGC